MIGIFIRHLLKPCSGKSAWQGCFESLHQIALAGMNYGGGGNPEDSGERAALAYVVTGCGGEQVLPMCF
jgi:hypothetical protein